MAPGLSLEPDHLFTLPELWPSIERYGTQYRYDPKVLAAIIFQESGFRNWHLHADETGHGLLGLDDNGLLPAYEQWSGSSVGRGRSAQVMPPEQQIEYGAYQLARYQVAYGGDPYAAARAWHRGGGLMNDARGLQYELLIRAHVKRLFG